MSRKFWTGDKNGPGGHFLQPKAAPPRTFFVAINGPGVPKVAHITLKCEDKIQNVCFAHKARWRCQISL